MTPTHPSRAWLRANKLDRHTHAPDIQSKRVACSMGTTKFNNWTTKKSGRTWFKKLEDGSIKQTHKNK